MTKQNIKNKCVQIETLNAFNKKGYDRDRDKGRDKGRDMDIDINNNCDNDFVHINQDDLNYCKKNIKIIKKMLVKNISNETYNNEIHGHNNVIIVSIDPIDIACELQTNNYCPCVSCLLSDFELEHIYNGLNTYEYSVFRRSCLHLCLKEINIKDIETNSILYIPKLIIIKKSDSYNYLHYDNYKTISFICYQKIHCVNDMIDQLNNILSIGYNEGHDAMILNYNNIIDRNVFDDIVKKYEIYYKKIIVLNHH